MGSVWGWRIQNLLLELKIMHIQIQTKLKVAIVTLEKWFMEMLN